MTQGIHKIRSIQIGLLLVFSIVILPSLFKSFAIAVFSMIVLIESYRYKLKFDWKFFILNSIIYLVLVLSLIYSTDKEFAFRKLGTMASLIIFPFLFAFFTKQSNLLIPLKKYHLFFLTYIFAVIVLNLVFFFIFWVGEFSFFDALKHFPYLIDEKLKGYNIHAIYLSMHICIAIIFVLFLLIKRSYPNMVPMLIIGLIILLTFLLILNKKGPILGLILVVTLYLFLDGTKKHKLLLILTLSLIVSIIALNTKSRNQFSELVNISDIDGSEINSTNLRFTIYKNVFSGFLKHPFLGYGIGDSHNELLKIYKTNSETLYNNEYNTHNQYFSFLLSVGLLGTMVILYSLFLIYRKEWKKSNYLFLAVFGFYLFVMLFENILQRENAVIYYSFFVCFLQVIDTPDENI